MAREVERKFLVIRGEWRPQTKGVLIRQGYLSTEAARNVRVRVAGASGFLTIKGLPFGLVRAEFEYEIPVADATEMLDTLCVRPLIEKIRYRILHGSITWEVDEFLGDNAGLFLAEVELSEVSQTIELPIWVGAEVSRDSRYFNANLAIHPYTTWGHR